MDDFNLACLSEAKNEYTARLVNILTPHITDGIQSIFREAWNLCDENDEQSKYLITFQNFLARIPKWNQSIIEEETTRIIEKSGCDYLEDLVTCVHITQMKVLTSIRVGMKQKKLELDVPRIGDFIHRVYIAVARKLYKNVYLLERGIPALQIQRNLRELELIIRESILNTVRDSIPTDHILRAYMDPSTEIEEEVEEREFVEHMPQPDKSADTESREGEQVEEEKQADDGEKRENGEKEEETKPDGIVIVKEDSEKISEKQDPEPIETKTEDTSGAMLDIHTDVDTSGVEQSSEKKQEDNNQTESNTESVFTQDTTPKPQTLQFNDTDQVLNMDTNREEAVTVSKEVSNLEEIGKQRDQQRREEEQAEAEEDNLKILDEPVEDFNFDLEFESLDEKPATQRPETPIELGVESLPF